MHFFILDIEEESLHFLFEFLRGALIKENYLDSHKRININIRIKKNENSKNITINNYYELERFLIIQEINTIFLFVLEAALSHCYFNLILGLIYI